MSTSRTQLLCQKANFPEAPLLLYNFYMPSLLDDIKYYYRHFVLPRRTIIVHLAKSFLVILAMALALEIFVFNWNYFSSAHYNTINLENKISLTKNSEGYFRITEHNNTLEFNNLNTDIENIALLMDPSQPAKNIDVKILFSDKAHYRYFDSTDYTEGIPVVQVSTVSEKSQYINLKTTGIVNSLSINFSGDITYPILLKTVEINAHRPFSFITWRFFLTLFILLLIFMFRPSSAIYRIRINTHPKSSKVAIGAATFIECCLLTSFLLFGSNLVGIATADYNYGDWDGHSIVNTYEVGGDNAQQYAELAKSISEGHFYLDEEPPQWLKDTDSPYDKGARDELIKETGENCLFDVVYFDGKYYVYFGVVPVFIFYLPFFLLTGQNFPTAIGVLIALLFYVSGCSALLDRFARYHFKKVTLGLFLLMQVVFVVCSGILYLAKFPTFYSLPIACGLAFSVWGLYFWMCGRMNRSNNIVKRRVCYVVGSLCMALVTGCRPQFLVLSLLAFPLFWREYIKDREILKRSGLLDFICLIAPYIVIGAFIMFYNYARFGSVTDFGANYNLTLNDMTQRGWIFGRFAPAFFAYFIQSPNTQGVFPFIQPVVFDTTYMGQTIKEATFGGILACCPVLWVLFFAGPIANARNKIRQTKTITGVILVLVISGFVVAMVDAQMSGILERYYADFCFMFLAAAILLIFVANELLSDSGNELSARIGARPSHRRPIGDKFAFVKSITRRFSHLEENAKNTTSVERITYDASGPTTMYRLLMKVLIACVTISVAYYVLLCFVSEVGWYSDIYDWAYQDILETFSFWT